jgi:hypothetical protein
MSQRGIALHGPAAMETPPMKKPLADIATA